VFECGVFVCGCCVWVCVCVCVLAVCGLFSAGERAILDAPKKTYCHCLTTVYSQGALAHRIQVLIFMGSCFIALLIMTWGTV
jgi:hypothetical protein